MSLEPLIPFLAQSIKLHREKMRLSHEQVAAATGLSAQYLQFVESGNTNFSMKTLSTIAEALSVPPSELILSAEKMSESQTAEPVVEEIPPPN